MGLSIPLYTSYPLVFQTQALTASGHVASAIFCATPGKTISKIGAYISASTSGVIDIKLETTSAGVPSGTLVATGAELLNQSVAASTWYNWTLGTPYAVPSGSTSILCACIRWVSGSTTIRDRSGMMSGIFLPRVREDAASNATRAECPTIVVEYSDGTVQQYTIGITAQSSIAFNSTSNPDEIGNRFVAPFNCRCTGAMLAARMVASSLMRIRLYDADLNVLTTDTETTIGPDSTSSSGLAMLSLSFSSPIYLIQGKTYYITKTATNANNIYRAAQTWASDAHKAAYHDNISICYRQNDTGAFTIDTAQTETISPLIDASFSNHLSVSAT